VVARFPGSISLLVFRWNSFPSFHNCASEPILSVCFFSLVCSEFIVRRQESKTKTAGTGFVIKVRTVLFTFHRNRCFMGLLGSLRRITTRRPPGCFDNTENPATLFLFAQCCELPSFQTGLVWF